MGTFKGRSLGDLEAHLSSQAVTMPPNQQSRVLKLPLHLAHPITFLLAGSAQPYEIFDIEPKITAMKAYAQTFLKLLDDSNKPKGIDFTLTGPSSAQFHANLDILAGSMRPADVSGVLIKMMTNIPGGICGSVTVFDTLSKLVRNTPIPNHQQSALQVKKAKVHFIASTILAMSDPRHLNLLCAIFGFASQVCKGDQASMSMVAERFAPVLLCEEIENIDLSGVAPSAVVGSLKAGVRSWLKRLMRRGKKDPVSEFKLDIAVSVATLLTSLWSDVVGEMRRREAVEE